MASSALFAYPAEMGPAGGMGGSMLYRVTLPGGLMIAVQAVRVSRRLQANGKNAPRCFTLFSDFLPAKTVEGVETVNKWLHRMKDFPHPVQPMLEKPPPGQRIQRPPAFQEAMDTFNALRARMQAEWERPL